MSYKELAAQAAAVGEDMTQTFTSGNDVIDEGFYPARVCVYIEYGDHAQMYKDEVKPPRREFRLGFKLMNPEAGGKVLRFFDKPITQGSKSFAKKLFDKLNYSKDMTHLGHSLGRAYLVYVGKGMNKEGKGYNYVDENQILPPVNPMDRSALVVPELDDKDVQYFFWDMPTPESWATLYIPDNNFIQEKCMNALDFNGSKLQQMLLGNPLPSLSAPETEEKVAPATRAKAKVKQPPAPGV